MEILNIGPLELILIVIIALLLLGPRGMVKFMRQTGKLIRKIVRSPIWKDVMSTSKEIRSLPNKIVHEANLEEELKEFKAWQAQTKGFTKDLNEIQSELNIRPAELVKSDAIDQPVEKTTGEDQTEEPLGN